MGQFNRVGRTLTLLQKGGNGNWSDVFTCRPFRIFQNQRSYWIGRSVFKTDGVWDSFIGEQWDIGRL